MSRLAPTLQAYFTTYLVDQHAASAHTVSAYRDTWRMLLRYAAADLSKPAHRLEIDDLDAPLISGFLTYLEVERGNTVSTRNARLAAIHSLFSYAVLQHPEHAATIARVLAIPMKRRPRATDVTYLTPPEVTALLGAPDLSTPTGRRDHALIQVGVTTGLRVSELTGLRIADVHLGTAPHVLAHGKGRKDRRTPLDRDTLAILAEHIDRRSVDSFVFTTRDGNRMSRDALATRLSLHANTAAQHCPSLNYKRVTPHVLRHTAAMWLLAAGIDSTVIALWLGHESIDTTQVYLHADLNTKERALARTTPTGSRPGRYQPESDELLAFLQDL